MKPLNKNYLYLILLGVCGAFCSCSNDPVDYQAALSPLSVGGPGLTFGVENTKSVKIAPTDPTVATISVYREQTEAAASYPVKVLANDGNVFTVPQTVSFEAGAKKAEITIKFDEAELDKSYTLKLGFDEADMDVFSAYTNYFYTCFRIRPITWSTIGDGQWLDGWYGFWSKVTIQQRDDEPNIYRIKNPYTNELVNSYEYYPVGTYTEYLEFMLDENGRVSWETPIYINSLYEGVDIKGYYPSKLNSKYAKYDDYSVVEKDDSGDNIRYLSITPYWYMDETNGGWGIGYDYEGEYYYYTCYLAFPGVDLATEWEW